MWQKTYRIGVRIVEGRWWSVADRRSGTFAGKSNAETRTVHSAWTQQRCGAKQPNSHKRTSLCRPDRACWSTKEFTINGEKSFRSSQIKDCIFYNWWYICCYSLSSMFLHSLCHLSSQPPRSVYDHGRQVYDVRPLIVRNSRTSAIGLSPEDLSRQTVGLYTGCT